jgi:hypothetical protein
MGAGNRQAVRSEGGKRARAAKRAAADRDPGQFLALPYSVLTSPGWAQCSNGALVMLMFVLLTAPNGRLVACRRALAALGLKTSGSHSTHVRELLDAGLLVCTRQGSRPSKASWYGATWLGLGDQVSGMDISRTAWPAFRGSYMNPPTPKTLRAAPPGDGSSRKRTEIGIGGGSKSGPSGTDSGTGGEVSMPDSVPQEGPSMPDSGGQNAFLAVPWVAP